MQRWRAGYEEHSDDELFDRRKRRSSPDRPERHPGQKRIEKLERKTRQKDDVPAERMRDGATLRRRRNNRIGSMDPYALKIPERRNLSPSARRTPHFRAEPKHKQLNLLQVRHRHLGESQFAPCVGSGRLSTCPLRGAPTPSRSSAEASIWSSRSGNDRAIAAAKRSA